MGPHLDYAAATLFDIEVLCTESPREIPLQRPFADGRRLTRELESGEHERTTDVFAVRLCRQLFSRGSQGRDIRRRRQLTLRTPDEEQRDHDESEGRALTVHTTSRVGRE